MTLDRDAAHRLFEEWGWGTRTAQEIVLDALEACVVQDPRIARIEALIDEVELGVAYSMGNAELPEWVPIIRSALQGAD